MVTCCNASSLHRLVLPDTLLDLLTLVTAFAFVCIPLNCREEVKELSSAAGPTHRSVQDNQLAQRCDLGGTVCFTTIPCKSNSSANTLVSFDSFNCRVMNRQSLGRPDRLASRFSQNVNAVAMLASSSSTDVPGSFSTNIGPLNPP